ncbi:MAG: YcgN family cysteine cluster protein [Pseudomonadota bacterium]
MGDDFSPEPGFWRRKRLSEMTDAEWEALCDGCGLCCLILLEDEETGAVYETDVSCRLFDAGACRCADYGNRTRRVPTCVDLKAQPIAELPWMPETCAYRLVDEGRDLPDWHPLRSGDPESVHRDGPSVRGRTVSERDIDEAKWPERVVRQRI